MGDPEPTRADLREVLDSTAVAVVVHNANGTVFNNQAARAMFAPRDGDLLGVCRESSDWEFFADGGAALPREARLGEIWGDAAGH